MDISRTRRKSIYGILTGVIVAMLITVPAQVLAVPSQTSISGNGVTTHYISCDLSGAGATMEFHATKQGKNVIGTISITSPSVVDATHIGIYSGHITDAKLTKKGYVVRGVLDTVTDTLLGVYTNVYPGGICSPNDDFFTISGDYGNDVPISLVTVGSNGKFTGSYTGSVTKS